MVQIIINHLGRVGSTSVKEISIGKKSLKTIQTIPKLQIKSDIQLFMDNLNTLPEFNGLVFDLWSLPQLYQAIYLEEGQLRLDSMEQASKPTKKMIDDRVLFLDPNTEWYRYKYPVKNELHGNKKIESTRKSEIMNQRGFPSRAKEIFMQEDFNHNTAWKKLDSRNLLLSYISWHIDQNLKYGASVIIPPSPLIDGHSPSMLKLSAKINNITKELVFEETDAFWSFYVPIHPDAFRNEKSCIRILDMIRNNITPNSLIVLKFFRTLEIMNESVSRARFSRFLFTLDQLKQSYYDNIAIMTLDTKSEGFALMANGVDLTCDPLGGVKDFITFKRTSRKGEDTGDQDGAQDGRLKLYGKYFHPDTREFVSIIDLRQMISEEGLLPHDCCFCNKLHKKLNEIDSPEFPGRNIWNRGRRLHNFICRREEDIWLEDAVLDGNIKAPELYLSRRERGNKNLIDLLPTVSFDMDY